MAGHREYGAGEFILGPAWDDKGADSGNKGEGNERDTYDEHNGMNREQR
jgi:hypothetical protein